MCSRLNNGQGEIKTKYVQLYLLSYFNRTRVGFNQRQGKAVAQGFDILGASIQNLPHNHNWVLIFYVKYIKPHFMFSTGYFREILIFTRKYFTKGVPPVCLEPQMYVCQRYHMSFNIVQLKLSTCYRQYYAYSKEDTFLQDFL